jgi:hypothetical protein
MRDLSQSQDISPSLFDAPPPLSYLRAKDFVRWCCSFGADFRNSPDITNLRYWAGKNKIKMKDGDEADILDAARPLFLKRVEQAVRRAEKAERSEAPN